MKAPNHFSRLIIITLLLVILPLHAIQPTELKPAELNEAWTELWKSSQPGIQEPKLADLSEAMVLNQMMGRWTANFGPLRDPLTLLLKTNRLAEISGRNDEGNWTNSGEWQVVANKLVLFLKRDQLPSFIFKTEAPPAYYIFDPWAKSRMSPLNRPPDERVRASAYPAR